MPSLYKMELDPDVQEVLEQLRKKIANIAGVTLQGNRLTVRWNIREHLVDVQMIIEEVTTVEESKEYLRKQRAYEEVLKKYDKKVPHLREELYIAEYNETPD